MFGSALFAYFLIVSQRTAPGLISDQLMKDFNVTASKIGLLASIQFLAYSGLQIPIGILSDRYGPNFFLITGTLLSGLGTLIYSAATNIPILLFGRLLDGIGDAAIWVNLVLILSRWFKAKEFVGLLGLAGMSGGLGFLLATVPFSAWISLSGWRIPFFVTGIILCFCSVLLYFVLVKKPKQMRKSLSATNPAEKGHKREKIIVILRRVFFHRQAWATFLCHFGLVGTYVGFIGSWAVPYGMHVYGMTRSGASQLIMVGLVGALIGAPITSFISTRLGAIKKPYVIIHFVSLVSWGAFIFFGGRPPFSILVTLFLSVGFCNGSSALTFAAVRQSFSIKEVGVVSGFANMGGFLSAVLLPSIFGKVLDHFNTGPSNVGYLYGFIIPVIFAVFGLVGGILLEKEHKEAIKD
ncbi:MFS transporter [Clostridium sp. PL3]|uniref:MFS transporter n=1 Tax=Clostridium thailandense TaxID=2794346 RepID=A0A949X2X3_9CLOT|nr:MFS transporter [Clostridium thailandense]MBV7271773.1 MFS transporter [Clostridium thailandense]